jgi:hypothetical protein
MNRETMASAVMAASTPTGAGCSLWLWLSGHDAAWYIAILTGVLLASQLFWGWARWFRGEHGAN